MENVKQNGFLSGTNSDVWVNGEKLTNVASYEAKVTGSFDDVDTVGSYATRQQYHGYKIEGTIVFHKLSSSVMSKLAKAYKSGIMPEITIVSKQYDPATGAAERVAVTGVVFTEFSLAMLEAKSVTDEEFPFSAEDYDVLEEI